METYLAIGIVAVFLVIAYGYGFYDGRDSAFRKMWRGR